MEEVSYRDLFRLQQQETDEPTSAGDLDVGRPGRDHRLGRGRAVPPTLLLTTTLARRRRHASRLKVDTLGGRRRHAFVGSQQTLALQLHLTTDF